MDNKGGGDNSYYKALHSNKDDLYNLSVRKKAAVLCVRLLCDIASLQNCYEKISADDSSINKFIEENKQITLICKKIYNTVTPKAKPPHIIIKETDDADIRLYICALLSRVGESITALSNIISIRHIERELIYASEIILRQLIYILPYKIY